MRSRSTRLRVDPSQVSGTLEFVSKQPTTSSNQTASYSSNDPVSQRA